jgi:uncharacterized protein (DUF1778 family)
MSKSSAAFATKQWRRGKKNSQLWFTPEDMEIVKAAAKLDRRPVSTFCLLAVLAAARKVLKASKTLEAST